MAVLSVTFSHRRGQAALALLGRLFSSHFVKERLAVLLALLEHGEGAADGSGGRADHLADHAVGHSPETPGLVGVAGQFLEHFVDPLVRLGEHALAHFLALDSPQQVTAGDAEDGPGGTAAEGTQGGHIGGHPGLE